MSSDTCMGLSGRIIDRLLTVMTKKDRMAFSTTRSSYVGGSAIIDLEIEGVDIGAITAWETTNPRVARITGKDGVDRWYADTEDDINDAANSIFLDLADVVLSRMAAAQDQADALALAAATRSGYETLSAPDLETICRSFGIPAHVYNPAPLRPAEPNLPVRKTRYITRD